MAPGRMNKQCRTMNGDATGTGFYQPAKYPNAYPAGIYPSVFYPPRNMSPHSEWDARLPRKSVLNSSSSTTDSCGSDHSMSSGGMLVPHSPPSVPNKPAWDMDTLKSQIVRAQAGANEVSRAIETCTFKPREQAFTALIDLCGRMRDWRKALEVFEAMKRVRGVRPNKYTYSALIAACSSSGEWQKALEVFAAMQKAAKADPNCRPNQVTYGALISACERGSMHDMALEKFEEMRVGGIKPDQVTYTSVLCSCEKSNQWEKAEKILIEAHEHNYVGPPSVYCELLLFYATRKDYQAALDLFLSMQMAEVEADVHTCRALMVALEAGGQASMALQLLTTMEENGIPIDIETYNLALKALAHEGHWQSALDVLEDIRRAGLEPSEVTLEAVAQACEVGGEDTLAAQILAELRN